MYDSYKTLMCAYPTVTCYLFSYFACGSYCARRRNAHYKSDADAQCIHLYLCTPSSTYNFASLAGPPAKLVCPLAISSEISSVLSKTHRTPSSEASHSCPSTACSPLPAPSGNKAFFNPNT